MKLSIVTTLYQSAPHLDEFYRRVSAAAAALTPDYEIVFVNDGSPDRALELAVALFEQDAHVRVLDLSRNFGHHRAMMTGLAYARGELVFVIDSDLEDQPEWLSEFHQAMQRTHADVVYGVQAKRKGGWFERAAGALFYKSFNLMLEHPIPENIATARLMTRRYVQSLVQHRERELTLAALWAITGYLQVPVIVEKHRGTVSTYRLRHRIAVFVNAVTSFSNRPLIYIFYLGSAIMAVSGAYGMFLIWQTTHGRVGVPGWPTLIVSIWFLGGITIFCLGLIGVYLSKVFTEVKDRPYTIIRDDYDHSPEASR